MLRVPLPQSSIEPVRGLTPPLNAEYAPAPLDSVSLFNGVLKFDHEFAVVSDAEIEWVVQELSDMLGPYLSDLEVLLPEEAAELLVEETASGIPYSHLYGTRKGDVLKKVPAQRLWMDFLEYDQVISCTLKDELRPVGKDSRLFRPANVACILAGIMLFEDMNMKLAKARRETPYKIGVATPGLEMVNFWRDCLRFSSCVVSADGSQWDAHFQPWMVRVCCEFRCKYLPLTTPYVADVHGAVHRYYSQMYYGWTRVDGQLIRLVGNPSGHFNTASDNTLALIASYLLVARRLHIPKRDIWLACYGDDSIFSTRNLRFSGRSVREEMVTLGVWLETIGDEYTPRDSLVFIGTHPVMSEYGWVFSYDPEKLAASMWWRKKKASDLDYVRKLVALCVLCRFSPHYKLLWEWTTKLVSAKWPAYITELQFGAPNKCVDLYLNLECLREGWETVLSEVARSDWRCS